MTNVCPPRRPGNIFRPAFDELVRDVGGDFDYKYFQMMRVN